MMDMKFGRIIGAALALAALSACGADKETVAGVRTDALDASAWEGSQWISAADAPVVEKEIHTSKDWRAADGASWFVAEPRNAKQVVSAKWMATGLGVFDLYVNGQRIGEEVLKPGFTHAEKTKLSFTYDVSDVLKKGKDAVNQLSAQVTPGWWGDKIVTPSGHKGMIGRKCAFRSVLELSYADGTKECFGTDTLQWKAGIAGPVLPETAVGASSPSGAAGTIRTSYRFPKSERTAPGIESGYVTRSVFRWKSTSYACSLPSRDVSSSRTQKKSGFSKRTRLVWTAIFSRSGPKPSR